MLQSVYNQGVRYIAAGGNAMRLRHYLEQGVRLILSQLTGMITQPRGEQQLVRIAGTICYDRPLAEMMGEIFDIIGEHGRLEIRSGQGRHLEREYVEGMYWDEGLLSRAMIADQKLLRTEMENVAILITDLKIEDPDQLVPVLSMAMSGGFSSLLVIVAGLSDRAIGLLQANSKPETFPIAAVKAPGQTPAERGAALLDMVRLTGGTPYLVSAGQQTLRGIDLQDLGRARSAWANLHSFGIIGGKGDSRALRKHIADLRAAYRAPEDAESRQQLQQRIGKLIGGSAILRVGAATNVEIMTRRELAERTAEAMRGVLIEGVLPGGGYSLLACRPALREQADRSENPDKRAAYNILIEALAEPARTILHNAGHDPSRAMADLDGAGPGCGYDVNTGQVVDLAQAGIMDIAAAIKAAVHGAVTGAALALTTDVLVHHLKPKVTDPLYPSYARKARAAGRTP
ncbi:MAG: hypothetical protein ISS56_05010 [Anaerolineae bacterium]|nr:hypothetical protein [Anaerolineae bacterium]